jgi:hypothetical protein
VWLELWLRQKDRGTGLVAELVTDVLEANPGTHHIHFFRGISSLRNIAASLGWVRVKSPGWFDHCIAYRYVANGKRAKSRGLNLPPRVTTKAMPPVQTFITRRDALRSIKKIDATFSRTTGIAYDSGEEFAP